MHLHFRLRTFIRSYTKRPECFLRSIQSVPTILTKAFYRRSAPLPYREMCICFIFLVPGIHIYHSGNPPAEQEKHRIIEFLFEHLEQYGDERQDIEKAFDYSTGKNNSPGGLILTATDNDILAGAVVINKTGMRDYIPENILVYIATHKSLRGKGIGKSLMEAAIRHTDGDIALHVEPDNPAKRLYENLGFTHKYLEMRLKKK